MPRRKLNYREGDLVRLPLEEGRQAVGLLARIDQTGGCLGYFYLGNPPLDRLDPGKADLVKIFGDLGLLEGRWKVLGPYPGFRRQDWPLPEFAHQDPVNGAWYLRSHDEQTLHFTTERRVRAEEAEGHFRDGLAGAVALERLLAKLAEKKAPRRRAPLTPAA